MAIWTKPSLLQVISVRSPLSLSVKAAQRYTAGSYCVVSKWELCGLIVSDKSGVLAARKIEC